MTDSAEKESRWQCSECGASWIAELWKACPECCGSRVRDVGLEALKRRE